MGGQLGERKIFLTLRATHRRPGQMALVLHVLNKHLGPNSIEQFLLEFWLEKSLEFWLEIPHT